MNAIEVQGIGKNYKNYELSDVTFEAPKGYITGLIGPNGAGKSTIIKMIMGIVTPDQGGIRVLGQDTGKEEAVYKQKIGYISDENIFYDWLSMEQMKKVVAPFYKDWDELAFQRYMDQFELPMRKKIKDCSKGMKMKYAIAIALAHNPSLLIMDEPTAGLDPVFRRELLELLSEYILDEQKTILFSTHVTTDLDRIADYVTFLNRGRLVFTDTKDEILERYVLIKGGKELLDNDVRQAFVGVRETSLGFEGLSADRSSAVSMFGNSVMYQQPTLEDIMYFTVKERKVRV